MKLIGSDQRVLITGKTGTGKTTLAKYLTQRLSRLIVIDTKGSLSDWNLEPYSDSTVKRLNNGEPCRIRVRAPMRGADNEFWDEVFFLALFAGSVTVYIDELFIVTPPNRKPPEGLGALYTQGREFEVGCWASTQRPAWIPLYTISECEHYFMFYLALDEDKNRMSAFMGKEVLQEIQDPYGYYYAAAKDRHAVYSHGLNLSAPQVKASQQNLQLAR